MRRFLPVLALALVAACGDEFDPASQVDSLRVLAVRAEPPEIAPPGVGDAAGVPDRTTLAALVADPAQAADPARRSSVVYLACTGDPREPYGHACTSFEELRDVAALAARAAVPACAHDPAETRPEGLGVVGGITLAGVEACVHGGACGPVALPGDGGRAAPSPAYVLPPELRLDLLPAGLPQRVLGMEVVVIAVAIAAGPDDLLAGADPADPCGAVRAIPARLSALLAEREHVVAVKRLNVRGPDATDEPNLNPVVASIALDGATLPPDPADGPALAPGAKAKLHAVLPEGAEALVQTFTDLSNEGKPLGTLTEEWTYSFFAAGGELDRVHTRSEDEENEYDAPDEAGEVVLYLVVRDRRGGADFASRRVRVE